jgi:hypothetical protein
VRYYNINISGGPTFSSLIGGQNNPYALRVQFVIEKDDKSDVEAHSFVRVYGVTLDTLKQASNFTGAGIQVDGGFWSPSVPLGTAQAQGARRGMLCQATILACFGNWRGTDITLDLLLEDGPQSSSSSSASGPETVTPASGGASGGRAVGPVMALPPSRLTARRLPRAFAPTPRDDSGLGGLGGAVSAAISNLSMAAFGAELSNALQAITAAFGGGGFRMPPVNLIHNLQPGQWLGSAIQQTLTSAFKGVNVNLLLSEALKLNHHDAGFYQSLPQYAGYLKTAAAAIAGGRGISTFAHGNKLTLTDWKQPGAEVQLDYTDLIGQPTWIADDEIHFSTVMRADLIPPASVSMPQTIFGISGQNPDLIGNIPSLQTTFNGTFELHKVRHVGDSRSPDGVQWRTDCWAYTNDGQGKASSSVAGGPIAVTPAGDSGRAVGPVMVRRGGAASRLAARRVRIW